MRSLMVVLACAAGLSAQVAESDAATKLKQFEQNLANPLKFRPGLVSLEAKPQLTRLPLIPAPVSVCAIPLLNVLPDAAFKSNMTVIAPDPKVKFSILQVVPPAPSCEEKEKK